MGRRFEYKEMVDNTLTRHERYLYRGHLQIVALDMLNSANVKHTIVWDVSEPTATRPLCLSLPTADSQHPTVFYSFDQVKNVTELFDEVGAIAATYDYSPFGQLVASTGNVANPITFSAEVYDSILGLQYYNYRHLNLLDGRWVNRDPIEEEGGVNLYELVANSPLGVLDCLGGIPIDLPPSIGGPKPGMPSREEWYKMAIYLGNIAPGLPQKLLRNYIFNNGAKMTLTKGEITELEPLTSLYLNPTFNSDLLINAKRSQLSGLTVKFEGKYNLSSAAQLNGTLGTFGTIASVNVLVCATRAGSISWNATGTATIYDEWDFDRKLWEYIKGKLWLGPGNGRTWYGQWRTMAGSFIPGTKFIIDSETIPVSEKSGDKNRMQFK